MTPANRTVRAARAAELLKQCCTVCNAGDGHACDQVLSPEFPLTDDPGQLAAVGPLHPDVLNELERVTARSVTYDNRVQLLVNGTQSFAAMFDLIDEADEEILFENFIFRADRVGLAFALELKRRADQGVAVRVLHDPFGSLMTRRVPIGFYFHRSPVWVRVYNPPRPTLRFLRWGRDHRKLVVQDRRRLVAGGFCIADAWAGNCVTRCTWRDSGVLVEGTAAHFAVPDFERTWQRGVSFTPRIAAPSVAAPHPQPAQPAGAVPVRILADEPGAKRTENALITVANAARFEILISNPYFLPTRPLAEALLTAARRGVDVNILIPRFTNHRVTGLASEHALGRFLKAGVRVWRWNGPMMHAKTAVVDRSWSLIGSSNLDALSLRRNAELNVEVHGPSFGTQMAMMFEQDRGGSTQFSWEEWQERPRLRRIATWLTNSAQRWL